MDQQILVQLKAMCDSLERLKSIEQLLERVACSSEEIAKMMEKSWQAYSQIKEDKA